MTKSGQRQRQSARGFSLIEVAVVLVIVTILLASVTVPLASQIQLRRTVETKKILEESKEALLGFVISNGRFPCPAAPNATGVESFCVATSGACTSTSTPQTHGNCSNFYDGFLPGSSLGLAGLDEQGYLRDAWNSEKSRIRYAVHDTTSPAPHVLTAEDGMRQATLSNLGSTTKAYLFVCSSGAGVVATSCGTSQTLTDKAPALIFSLGANAVAGGTGVDESKNTDGDIVFVSHTPTVGGTNEFDDILTWVPIAVVLNKMVTAGRLP